MSCNLKGLLSILNYPNDTVILEFNLHEMTAFYTKEIKQEKNNNNNRINI